MNLTKNDYRTMRRVNSRKFVYLVNLKPVELGRVRRLDALGLVQIVGDFVGGVTPDGKHAMEEYEMARGLRRREGRRWRITTAIAVAALLKSFLPELRALGVWLAEVVNQIIHGQT